MTRELVNNMIIIDESADNFLVLSPKGKSKSVHEVKVGENIYYCPYLGTIKKKDYPLLSVGVLTDKNMVVKIEKQLL